MNTRAKCRGPVALHIEQLEGRICPAFDIYYTNSALVIAGAPTEPFVNPGDGLQLQMTGGAIEVHEVSGAVSINYGSYHMPALLEVDLAYNTDHDFTFDLGGGTFSGNVDLNLGRGNTDVHTVFFSPYYDNIQNGTIGGNLNITGGSGGEQINLGTSEGLSGTAELPLTVGGNTTLNLGTEYTSIGGNFLNINAGSEVLGNVTGNSVENINVGELPVPTVNTGAAFVGGNIALNASQSGNAGILTVNSGVVGGNVTFQGSQTVQPFIGDSIFIGSTVSGSTAVVEGNISATFVNDGTSAAPASFNLYGNGTVNQNLNLNGGKGDTFVNLTGNVIGSANLNLQNSDNTVQFLGVVGGNLGVNVGNGDNDLTDFTGQVSGNLSLNLGNGTNNAIISNAPLGQLTWSSGYGTNSLTFGSALTTGSELWNANVQFGDTGNAFNLAGTPAGTTQTLDGVVDSDWNLAGNTFSQSANWVLANTSFINSFS